MDIKAKIKTDVLAYKNILDKSSASKLSSGTIVHISGIKKYGVKSYYVLQGANLLVEPNVVKIIRDEEFYYANYSSRKFQKNNLAMMNADGLSSALDDITEVHTTPYIDLQLFARGEGKTIEVDSKIGTLHTTKTPTVGGGFGGGMNGGIISTTNPMNASNNIANTQISALTGLDKDSTGGQLLQGVSIGSLFDGSFLNTVATNLFNMIAGFFGNKLKFVIGFDFAAGNAGSNGFLSGYNATKGQWSGWVGDTITRPDVTITYYGTGGSVIPDQYTQRQLPNTPVNPAYEKYFSKYGYIIPLEEPILSERSLMTIADTKYQFMGGYHTGTASPSRSSIETQYIKAISDAKYDEFKDSMDKVKEEFNLHIDRKTTFTKFNRFRVPTPDNELCNTRGHIFFTRPDLNFLSQKDSIQSGRVKPISSYAQVTPLFSNMAKSHSVLMSYLQGNAAPGGDNMIPILSHCCTGIDISDEILETVEAHESFTGWKVVYGKSNLKSKTAGTMNVAFVDDNMLSVYKILKVWTEYISSVYRGDLKPKDSYAKRHILDYAISIYYFLCKENDEDILFWSKYTGCFPTATPASNFSDTIDKHIERPSYSVPFSFAKKSDYNPLDIYEFNRLTESLEYDFLPTYNTETYRVNKSFVGAPFVDTLDGTHLYKLRFRKA